jgi:LPXTG-motif cell wall-anchored protein
MHCVADQLHAGMDFIADRNTPVLIPVDGVVALKSDDTGPGYVRAMRGYGNSVVIRVDRPVPGLPTPFFYSLNHFNAPSPLVVGQRVTAGMQAGVVGNTTNGQFRTMPPHLHFEVRIRPFPGSYDRDTVDPAVLWEGLGIDWVGHNLVGGRQSGGQLLIRARGPSDCSAHVSGLSGLVRLGAYLDPSTPALQAKYASKGTSTKTIDENGPDAEPPEYQDVVQTGGGSNTLLLVGVGAALLIGGMLLLKKRDQKRSGLRGFSGNEDDEAKKRARRAGWEARMREIEKANEKNQKRADREWNELLKKQKHSVNGLRGLGSPRSWQVARAEICAHYSAWKALISEARTAWHSAAFAWLRKEMEGAGVSVSTTEDVDTATGCRGLIEYEANLVAANEKMMRLIGGALRDHSVPTLPTGKRILPPLYCEGVKSKMQDLAQIVADSTYVKNGIHTHAELLGCFKKAKRSVNGLGYQPNDDECLELEKKIVDLAEKYAHDRDFSVWPKGKKFYTLWQDRCALASRRSTFWNTNVDEVFNQSSEENAREAFEEMLRALQRADRHKDEGW